MAKRAKEHRTEQENIEWDELYKYVHDEILGYDENQKLSRYMILKLLGLHEGNYVANRNIKKNACYPFSVITNTFKACRSKIEYALKHKSFNSEQQKINYIIAIVEGNINDIYIRMKNAKIAEQNRDSIDMSVAINTDLSQIYERRKNDSTATNARTKNRYDSLW